MVIDDEHPRRRLNFGVDRGVVGRTDRHGARLASLRRPGDVADRVPVTRVEKTWLAPIGQRNAVDARLNACDEEQAVGNRRRDSCQRKPVAGFTELRARPFVEVEQRSVIAARPARLPRELDRPVELNDGVRERCKVALERLDDVVAAVVERGQIHRSDSRGPGAERLPVAIRTRR